MTSADPPGWFRTNAAGVKLVGSERADGRPAFVVEWPDHETLPVAQWDKSFTNAIRFEAPMRAWIDKKDGTILRFQKDILDLVRVIGVITSFGANEREFQSIDLVSHAKAPSPFVIAITVE